MGFKLEADSKFTVPNRPKNSLTVWFEQKNSLAIEKAVDGSIRKRFVKPVFEIKTPF